MSQDIATIRVTRYRPEKDTKPYFQEYKVPYRQDMVVLDALNYIKAEIDGSLNLPMVVPNGSLRQLRSKHRRRAQADMRQLPPRFQRSNNNRRAHGQLPSNQRPSR